mmetsp:Transcript_32352/g.34848  ORF Transcript_32352/g.34848 Transcript_32352/m.34848 type:complete len:167 (+) Transcript_32352:79-579(+)
MIFNKFNTIVLASITLALGADGAQLRGRELTKMTCPKTMPTGNASCAQYLPTGMSMGKCFWESTSTTVHTFDSCECLGSTMKWSNCLGGAEAITPKPTAAPKPTPAGDEVTWCPQSAPTNGTICNLPDPKINGVCQFWATAQGKTTYTECKCAKGGSPFTCQTTSK